MKKIFWAFIISLFLLASAFGAVEAKQCTGPNASGFVPCGQDASCPCEIIDLFAMVFRVFDFFIKWIVGPLATLMLIIGGIMILISAGNPNLAGLGKKTLYAAIIGLALVFCSWIIINFILTTIGYRADWNVL